MTTTENWNDSQQHFNHDDKNGLTDSVVDTPSEVRNGKTKRLDVTDPDTTVLTAKRQRVFDPDYEEITDQQNQRQRELEEDAKEATKRKIQRILQTEFLEEIHNKQSEINIIDQRLNQARVMMDRLRACIVANFYGTASQQGLSKGKQNPSENPSIHPAVKKHLGKAPVGTPEPSTSQTNLTERRSSTRESTLTIQTAGETGAVIIKQEAGTSGSETAESENKTKILPSLSTSETAAAAESKRGSRFKMKKKIIVGNVSKFIPMERRDVNDQASHKWMVYVRGPQSEPEINDFVKKVWFFLHPSYRPNDLVEVSQPPFHLTRRGWGEFPVRVQLHFWDSRNKRVDIIHQLVLDKTCTGLQTLGSETVVEIELEKEDVEDRNSNTTNMPTPGVNKEKIQTKPGTNASIEKGGNLELSSHVKQESTFNVEENDRVVVRKENLSPEMDGHRKDKPVRNGNKRKLGCSDDVQSTSDISKTVKDVMKENELDVTETNQSHRKRIKLKEELLEYSSEKSNSSTADLSSVEKFSNICDDDGIKSPKQTNLSCGRNKVFTSAASQGKNLSQGWTPKISLISKPAASPKSQMYLKSTDAHGNVILRLVGERIPGGNIADSSQTHLKTGQISLLDGKKKISSDSTKTSFMSPSKTSKPLIFSLAASLQTSASCSKNSSSAVFSTLHGSSIVVNSSNSGTPTSGTNSSEGSVTKIVPSHTSRALAAGVNSSPNSRAPVINLNSSHGSAVLLSSAVSSNKSVASASSVHSSHISGAPITGAISIAPDGKANSSQSFVAPVSGANSSKAPPMQSVRLVVTAKGLKMVPVGDEMKTSVSSDSSNSTDSSKLEPRKQSNERSEKDRDAPQLMLANIGAQTYVLKVVPNQISNPSSGAANKITDTSTSLLKNSLLTGSLVSSKVSSTNKDLAFNVTHSASNQQAAFSARTANQKEVYIKSLLKRPCTFEEKKLLVLRKEMEREKDTRVDVPSLNLSDHSDMLSLIRAAVQRHPVVRDHTDPSTHPYCAKSTEQWLDWNIGKRRASEWQRASSVKRFIAKQLEDGKTFKGEQLWTTKQIMTWCRFHAYSPHYLEKLSKSQQSGFSKSERISDSVPVSTHDLPTSKVTTLSELSPLISQLTSELETHREDEETGSSEEEIEIVSLEDKPKVKMKEETDETVSHEDQIYLPTSEQAAFVQEAAQKIGVGFQPSEVEDGVLGSVSEDMIFGAMKSFMEDILREAFQVNLESNKNVDTVSVMDVYQGLSNLKQADFITNKNMGVREDSNVS